jgi:hypothetical protein
MCHLDAGMTTEGFDAIALFEMSGRTGEGVDAWADWPASRMNTASGKQL